MSLGSVNNKAADHFGYRLITPFGDVVPLSHSDLKQYRADENDAFVARVFETQTRNMADRGIHAAVVMPAKAGALIVASHASEAEKVLDAVFGVPALEHVSRSAQRAMAKTNGLKQEILDSFGSAAAGDITNPLPLVSDFKTAVGKPANLDYAPQGRVYDENMRLAA